MSWTKVEMADKVLEYIDNDSSVNLGIGLPTMVAEQVKDKDLWIHSENGVLGVKGRPSKESVSPTLINAGKETVSIKEGASFFNSSLSFGMIRGGHIDYCILGGMEADTQGSLANWMIPGKKLTGMGGAMDLVNGAKNVFIMMTHYNKHGEPKLVKECTLPLTGKSVINLIFTDIGVFKPHGSFFEVLEMAPGETMDQLNKDTNLFKRP